MRPVYHQGQKAGGGVERVRVMCGNAGFRVYGCAWQCRIQGIELCVAMLGLRFRVVCGNAGGQQDAKVWQAR